MDLFHSCRQIGFGLALSVLIAVAARGQTAPTTLPNDPMKRTDLARAMEKQGRHREALEHYLWSFDHGLDHDPAYFGVRLSFLLRDIAELGEVYPPALEALRQRMGNAEQALLSGKGERMQAIDFASIAETLGEFDRAMTVHEKLAEMGPQTLELREPILEEFMGALLAEKQYDRIVAALPQSREWLDQQLESAEQALASMRARAGESPREALKVAFVGTDFATDDLLGYFEAFVGGGRRKDAEYLADRLLRLDDGKRMRTRLSEAARRGRGLGRSALAPPPNRSGDQALVLIR